MYVIVLDVAPVLTQMHGNPVGTRCFRDERCIHRVRFICAPRLSDGRYVIFSGVDRNRVTVGTIEDVTSDPFAAVEDRKI